MPVNCGHIYAGYSDRDSVVRNLIPQVYSKFWKNIPKQDLEAHIDQIKNCIDCILDCAITKVKQHLCGNWQRCINNDLSIRLSCCCCEKDLTIRVVVDTMCIDADEIEALISDNIIDISARSKNNVIFANIKQIQLV